MQGLLAERLGALAIAQSPVTPAHRILEATERTMLCIALPAPTWAALDQLRETQGVTWDAVIRSITLQGGHPTR
ncbi:MAG TPA: hypothetical protein DIW46_02050 [Microbacterium sp.]|nr:hypothetical protein [Microbacterium sp.]